MDLSICCRLILSISSVKLCLMSRFANLSLTVLQVGPELLKGLRNACAGLFELVVNRLHRLIKRLFDGRVGLSIKKELNELAGDGFIASEQACNRGKSNSTLFWFS